MSGKDSDAPWSFERLHAGRVLGSTTMSVSDEDVERYLSLYAGEPDTRPVVPAGMASLVAMRGYALAVTPRPPGNVHAGQRLTVMRLPRVGEPLSMTVTCESAEIRKERRWVCLVVEAADTRGEVCIRAVNTSLWAR